MNLKIYLKKIAFCIFVILGESLFADSSFALKPALVELPKIFAIEPNNDCYELSFIAKTPGGNGKVEAVVEFWESGNKIPPENGGNVLLKFDVSETIVCASTVKIPIGAASAKINMRAFLDSSENINVSNVRFVPKSMPDEKNSSEGMNKVSNSDSIVAVSAVINGKNILRRKRFNPEVVLQKARAAAKTESDNGQSIPASQNVYYVDPDYGSDENSGEYAYAAGRAGPKRTVHGALKSAEANGTQSSEIVLSGNSNKPHRAGVVSMPGKTLIIRTQGTAIIKGGEQ